MTYAQTTIKADKEPIEERVSHILEEARMVLPGIQALLGFQLVAVFNQSFAGLPMLDKQLHLSAIFLSINAICFLLTPAALHRQSSPDRITKTFAKTSSKLICMGMLPLLLSLVLDAYVVSNLALHSPMVSVIYAGILLVELSVCWIVWPQLKRRRGRIIAPDC